VVAFSDRAVVSAPLAPDASASQRALDRLSAGGAGSSLNLTAGSGSARRRGP
jgi:hypothetical protein